MRVRSWGLACAAVTAVIATGGAMSEARADDGSAQASSPYSGFYFGLTGGYGAGNTDIHAKLRTNHLDDNSQKVSEDGKGDLDGGMIGGLVGYDYNVGNGIVIGFMGDMSWAGIQGNTDVDPDVVGLSGSDYSFDTSVEWLGTARARIGFEVGNALIYGTGGLAFGGIDTDLRVAGDGKIDSNHDTRLGWTVGGGVNYMASEHVMLGVEYLYVDLGKQTEDFGKSGKADVDLNMSIIRGTLSYKF